MVVARMAQPRPIKIRTPAQPPMVRRIVDKYVPKVAGDEARRRRSAQVKSKSCPGWNCNRHQPNYGASPSGRSDQVHWRMMVPLVYLRKDWRVVKENAMQQIFDQCPAHQSGTVDDGPNRGLRRGHTSKRE